ncbi:unnamed protein product [Brassica oleracea]|uniref:Ubiquitin-like protease family profile domain-containing protein n=1 Tax=Brassica oleracea var. oleracea TaxID=109376 RepID=A0A0D3D674_BRAOL
MLNKILRSVDDDCCSVILKDNSDDFQEVFYEVLHSGSLPDDLRLHRRRLDSVIKFVQKDFGEIFPRWDFDVEDSAAENIIKAMFNAKLRWKWTMDCWEGKASKVSPTEARSEAFTTVGGMTKKQIEKSFRDIDDVMRDGFGMCLKEIKLLWDMMEVMEKKVGITKKGTTSNDLQITASSPPKRGHEPESESVNGVKGEHNDAQEPSSSKELRGSSDKEVKAMEYVRGKSERERKLAVSHQSLFKGNNTTKLIIPNKRVCQGYNSFAPVDKKMSKVLTDWVKLDPNEHWIAIWISIPKKHIVVWDIIISHISCEDLDVVMQPFVTMVHYLLVECSSSDEQRVQHTLEPYTYERVTIGVPQCQAGDCGVFTLKYIECHALGMSFPPESCNKNEKAIREKMALDIFK